MSDTMTSAWAPNSLLYGTTSGQGLIQTQQNALNMQRTQQDVGVADMSVVGRAAASLLNMPEDQAAAAYGPLKQSLQAQGFGKNLPDQYPGHATAQAFVQRALTVPEQYQYGLVTAPGLTEALKAAGAPLASPGQGGGATAPSGGTGTSDNNFGNIRPVGAAAGFNTYTTPQEGIAAMSSNLAAYASQHGINTLNGLTARWAPKGDGNNDPVAYAAALGKTLGLDPNAEINLADPLLQTRLIPAMAAIEKGRPFNQPAEVLTAGIQAGLSGKGGTAARPAAPGVPGTPGQPAPYQVATAGPTVPPPPGGTPGAPAVPPPATVDLTGPRPLPQAGPGSSVATPTSLANTPLMVPPNALAPPAPAVAAVPVPTPAPTQSVPPPAQPAPSGGTGVNSPQFQAAMELNRRAQALDMVVDPTGRTKAMAASLRAQAALYMQADSVRVDPNTGIQTKQLTGEQLNAAAPNAHYVWDESRGSYVDTTGIHPPVTPPSPRLTTTPGGDIIQSKPGGGATVVYTTTPARLSEQEAAKAEGAATGTATAKALPAMIDQGRSAAQAEGNIDYGLSQLDRARAGGINTGYFSSALTTAASAAKSLGIPPQLIGIDPSAIGNIQTARKTLSVVSGAILQQILGPGSPITDSKIDAFIHAQPGIETDPDAVRRVLAWARSQFTYEREMAQAAVKEASNPANQGRLPPGWQASYYNDRGFAPIYNPGTGEMQQPDGSAPGRASPAAVETAPVNPAARTAGTTYSTPKGPMKWTGTGWLPAQ